MLYPDLLSKLYSLSKSRGVDMGLERMQALAQILRIRQIPAIHIAGTNGKGSVTTKIASALTFSGYKTVLFTSPHISSFRERFQIDGKMISEENICRYAARIFACSSLEPTFFEVATLIMFLWAMDEKVDFLVLEVGLGGRLDATNICSPVLTCITSIDFDHEAILGSTLEKIASEKAGIIKPNCPVVIGRTVPRSVVEPLAQRNSAPLIFALGKFDNYEEENQEIARICLQTLQEKYSISEPAINRGLAIRPPCRYERFIIDGVDVVLDVAHNPHGVRALFQRAEKDFACKPCVVFGCSQDKDLETMAEIIQRFTDFVFVTEAKTSRAASKEELQRYLPTAKYMHSLREPLDFAQKNHIPLLIFGSFYIMADIRDALGLEFYRDPEQVGELYSYRPM